ncbi:MAG TPA: MmoB/DmpM family protein [Capillimicrobium sp.]|nr:MmoB/DmpM family protein [Capillimicrobium sp.]
MSAEETRLVGPAITDPRIADAVARAIATDTGAEPVIDSRGGYLRVQLPLRARMTQASLEEELGVDMPLARFEQHMPSFAGRIKVSDDEIVWYLEEQS